MRNVLLLATIAAVAMAQQPEKTADQFYSAIRENNLTQLKVLLAQEGSANVAGDRGITPLMYAAEIGSAEAMRMLIDHGADVNAQNAFGSTSLMWSVQDPVKTRLLLDHGAQVNTVARSGRTALIVAGFTNPSAEVVKLLLSKGAKVDIMDTRHVTPLNAATFGNDTATVRLLLEAGADISTPDTFIGLTPLMNAAGNRNVDAVKLLLAKGAGVNAVSKTEGLPKIQTGTVEFGGWTPLLMASAFGPPEAVNLLLNAGARIDAQDYRGFTPLMLAVGTDRYDRRTVNMLLAHGADLQPTNHDGETALDWANKFGDKEVIRALGGSPKDLATPARLQDEMPDVHTAVSRSLALLDRTNDQFFHKSGCVACHEQPPATFAAAAARSKGFSIDDKAFTERLRQITTTINPIQLEGAAALGGADNNLYSVEALVRAGYPANRITDFLAANLAASQGGDGGWHLPGYSRSPIQDSDFSRTAMAMRALKTYGTPGRAIEMKQRLERGKQWMTHAKPVILEDMDIRLVGVAAAGASPAELRKLAEPIIALQRSDGGWAQRKGFPSDAYATGMTMWALNEAGVMHPDAKGVRFLLGTQSADGSWHVASRATKFQQYFESGFPYGHDQWISTMATGWATNALALSIGN
ncbi:MAG TPA: ankyrin repeat domain-containing protein [Bryobacteraceae bacterium]|jgi:ankyrin repeat protein|nr:ankyrin repeat domain-containing protein [Bryobacteraceae bacterium]